MTDRSFPAGADNMALRPIGAKPSQEELEMQAKRAFLQKRNALAEQIMLSSIQGGKSPSEDLVTKSVETADELMKQLYSVKVEAKEE